MSGSKLLRIKKLFLEASDLPRDQRSAFLDAQELDPALRARVEAQLDLHDSGAAVPLESPAVRRFEERDPEVIGPYRVLRRIGEGGMGVVYLAEQTEPVRRQVAVKRVKAGMDSAAMLRRFEAERSALERMDHPAIARVLDAGIDRDGRPYFAMEYVDGLSLTDYCDREQLGPEARLALFVDVCRGVQHAHQKGVLHRDLKPSNVLVTTVDGRPTPKIIDFGVAKALERHLTEQTVHTQLGVMIGTPEYMSPEQAEPGAADIDTRSDVYSLGVMLYELLSGDLPFSPAYLREQGLAGIQRVLQEEEPQRPSTRVGTVSERTTALARARRLEPRTLAQHLRGDLDWITMRALHKQRDGRYGSCGEFAADIERHLRCEPVLAGPPTLRYRLQKFVRRYRAQVVTVSLVAAALLLGTGVSIWFALDARALARQRDAARGDVLKEKAAVERVLHQAVVGIGQGMDRDGDPVHQARLHGAVGAAYAALSRHKDARLQLREVLDLLDLAPDASAMDVYRILRPFQLVWVAGGGIVETTGFFERFDVACRAILSEGEPELRAALQALNRLKRSDSGTELFTRLFATAERRLPPGDPRWIVLAELLSFDLPNFAQRVEVGRRLLSIFADQGLALTDPGWLTARVKLIQHCNMPAVRHTSLARDMAVDALSELEPALPRGHYFEGMIRLELGYALARLGELKAAEPQLRASQRILDLELGTDNQLAMWALMALVDTLDRQHRSAAAEPLRMEFARRASRAQKQTPGEWLEVVLRPNGEALARAVMALDEVRFEPARALPQLAQVMARCREELVPGPAAAMVANYLGAVGMDVSNSGGHSGAMRPLYEYVDEVMGAAGWRSARNVAWLADHCYQLGDFAAGERVVSRYLASPEATDDRAWIAILNRHRALSRCGLGDDDALELARAAYQELVAAVGVTNGDAKSAFSGLMTALRHVGETEEARQLAVARFERICQEGGNDVALWGVAYSAIWQLGDDDLADTVAQELAGRFPHSYRTALVGAQLAAIRFDRERAMRLVEQALVAAPDSWYCRSVAAKIYCRLGLAGQAYSCAQRAVERHDTASTRNKLAIWHARLRATEQALALYEENAETYPDFALAHANLAAMRLRLGELDGAHDSAQRAYRQEPRVGGGVLASVLRARGEDATELFIAQAELSARPSGNPQFWPDYTEALTSAGRFDEARSRLERMTRDWPTEPYAWSTRAFALCSASAATEADLRTAIACAEKAVRLSHGQGPVMLAALAEARFRAGEPAAAVAAIDRCLVAMDGRNAEWLALAEAQRRRARYAGG